MRGIVSVDFVLHYLGPGHTFTPWTYAIACLSFDWIVAIYIVVAYGVLGVRRLGFREASTTKLELTRIK